MNPEFAPVITGIGLVSPFGVGKERFNNGLRQGEYSIGLLDARRWRLSFACAGGCVRGFEPEAFDADYRFLRLPRITQLAVAATELAFADAGLKSESVSGEGIGIFSGIMHGVMDQTESLYATICEKGPQFANPLLFQNTVPNAIASEVGLRFLIKGPILTFVCGAASGLLALTMAINALRARTITMAIVIAAEEMSGRTLSVYRQLRLLSPGNGGNEVSCPFDSKRNGMILSEGAAAVILELAGEAKARGAVAQAQILGTGAAHDAAKAMGQNGTGLESAMRLALSDAHVSFDEVGYLAAAANSSRVLDAAEASAIRRVADGKLAQQLRVSSIRSMIGESFSAGALFNVAACVAAMHEGFIPPTVNYQHPDPHCELPLTSELLRQETRIAMANAASFGGNSASVVLGRCARNGVCQ